MKRIKRNVRTLLTLIAVVLLFSGCSGNPLAPSQSFVESGEASGQIRWAGFMYRESEHARIDVSRMENLSNGEVYEMSEWRYAANVPPGQYRVDFERRSAQSMRGASLEVTIEEGQEIRVLCTRGTHLVPERETMVINGVPKQVTTFARGQHCNSFAYIHE